MNDRITVLYAEDNPRDADLTKTHFQYEAPEFNVEIVNSGKECLAALDHSSYDVLLLDNHLTDMNGIDVLRQLIRRQQKVPVVMVTGLGDEELAVQALRAGAWDYIPKRREYIANLPVILRQVVTEFQRKVAAGEYVGPQERTILYIEHNAMDVDLTRSYFDFHAPNLTLNVIESPEVALRTLQENPGFDAVLVDLRMPEMTALDFLHEARLLSIHSPFIVLTGKGDEEAAIAALRLGAYDYIVKRDDYLTHLVYSIENAIARYQLNVVNRKLLKDLEELNKSLEQKVVERTAELQIEINERKKTADALRESEESLRTVVEYAPDAIVVVDGDTGKFIDANKKATFLYGLSHQDLLGLGPAEMSPPLQPDGRSSRESAREKIASALAGNAPSFEWLYIDAAGKEIPCEVQLVRLPKAGRNLIRGSVVDISDRKRAEQALKERERKLTGIFRAAPVGIGMTVKRVMYEVNDKMCEITGYSRDELLGQSARMVYPSDEEYERVGREKYSQIAERGTGTVETQWQRQDGAIINVVLSSTPLDTTDLSKGVIYTALDITERKRAEDALRESTEFNQAILQTIPFGMDIVDMEGNLLFMTPSMEAIVGKGGLGKKCWDLYKDDRQQCQHCPLQHTITLGQSSLIETEGVLGGRVYQVNHTGMQFQGKLAVLEIFQDITERKRDEEQLRLQSAALEAVANSIAITDHNGHIIWCNAAFTRLTGYELHEVMGRTPKFLKSDYHDKAFYQELWDTIRAGNVWHGEIINRRKDGTTYTEEMTITPMLGDRGQISHFIAIKQDITERKRTEEAMRDSENRYRSLFEYSPISLWIEDYSELEDYLGQLQEKGIKDLRAYLRQDGNEVGKCLNMVKIVDVNKTTLALYGAKDKKELLTGLGRMVGHETSEAQVESIMAIAEGKRHFEIEAINYTLKKKKIHISLRWSVMPTYEKTYSRVLVSIIDISERKQAELRLQESESRFRMAVNNYPSAFVIYDARRRLQFVNARGIETSGHPGDAMIGKRDEDLFPDSRTRPYLPTLKKAVRTREPQSVECTLKLAGGNVTVIANYIPLLDERGKINEILGITYDITERKHVEEILLKEKNFSDSLIESLPGVFYLIDRHGRFVRWNGVLKKVTGYSDHEITQRSTLRLFAGKDRRIIVRRMREVFERSESAAEASLISKSGKTTPYYLTGKRIMIDKKPHLVGMGIDIRERKEAEDRIQASLQEKEVLLKEIHHRVKNNMQVISSLLNLQSRKISDRAAREAFKESQNRIRSMALIHERLYLSKDFARVEFADYIRNLTAHLLRIYNIHPNTIKLKLSLEPVVLSIDTAIPCGLIVNELVANCMKHAFPAGKKGEIVIELVAATEVGKARSQGRSYRLTIKDNGVGIPRAFDIEKTDSLGLRLVNTLVKQISGSLKLIRSKGTQFKITFKA